MSATASEIRIEALVLAKLRGFCAGVVRAIEVVEAALRVCPPPLYVRKEIVHNRYVVEELRGKGARFVDELDQVPDGAWVIFSAHGVAPSVIEDARRRGLKTIDATCPLVTKVHVEALHYAKRDHSILLIGHGNHEETVGTLGYAPEHMVLVENIEQAETVTVKNPEKIAVLTQTTLSLDDTREVLAVLKRRFPALRLPAKEDICYATQNRQNAVKALLPHIDALLVIGAKNSSNSQRLKEVGLSGGVKAMLIDRAADIPPEWLAGVRRLGLTSGASAPEILVQEAVAHLRERYGVTKVEEVSTVEEDVHFALPKELEELL